MKKIISMILLVSVCISYAFGISEMGSTDINAYFTDEGTLVIVFNNDSDSTEESETEANVSDIEAELSAFLAMLGFDINVPFAAEIVNESLYNFSQTSVNEQIKAISTNADEINAIVSGVHLIDYLSGCSGNGISLSVGFIIDTLNSCGFSCEKEIVADDTIRLSLTENVSITVQIAADGTDGKAVFAVSDVVNIYNDPISVMFRLKTASTKHDCMFEQSQINSDYGKIDKAHTAAELITGLYLLDYMQNIRFDRFVLKTDEDFENIFRAGEFAYSRQQITESEIAYRLSDDMYIGLTFDTEKQISQILFTVEQFMGEGSETLKFAFPINDLFQAE